MERLAYLSLALGLIVGANVYADQATTTSNKPPAPVSYAARAGSVLLPDGSAPAPTVNAPIPLTNGAANSTAETGSTKGKPNVKNGSSKPKPKKRRPNN